MKRPDGFDSAVRKATELGMGKNMRISAPLIVDLHEYIKHLEQQLQPAQPRKTVHDAVEYYSGTSLEVGGDWRFIRYNTETQSFFATIYDDIQSAWYNSYQVCTREEFEAACKNKSGDVCGFMDSIQWSHSFSQPCSFSLNILDEKINVKCNGEVIWQRKPRITKAEAWDILEEYVKDKIKSLYEVE